MEPLVRVAPPLLINTLLAMGHLKPTEDVPGRANIRRAVD